MEGKVKFIYKNYLLRTKYVYFVEYSFRLLLPVCCFHVKSLKTTNK